MKLESIFKMAYTKGIGLRVALQGTVGLTCPLQRFEVCSCVNMRDQRSFQTLPRGAGQQFGVAEVRESHHLS